MTPPAWVTPDVMAKLRVLKDFSFQVNVPARSVVFDISFNGLFFNIVMSSQVTFGVTKQQEKSRLQGGECVWW